MMKCNRSRHSEATLPCWHQAWHDCCVFSGSGTLSDVSIHGDFCTFIEILLGFQGLIDISCSGQSLNFVNPQGRGAGLLSLPSSSVMSYMRKWTRVPQICCVLALDFFFFQHTPTPAGMNLIQIMTWECHFVNLWRFLCYRKVHSLVNAYCFLKLMSR